MNLWELADIRLHSPTPPGCMFRTLFRNSCTRFPDFRVWIDTFVNASPKTTTTTTGENAARAVFRTIAFTQNGEVCTVYASADYFLWKSGQYFSEPLVLQYFQLCAVSASDFLGAVDDEVFFVVEGSGVEGSPGV